MKAVYKKHTKVREFVFVRGQRLELPDHMTKEDAVCPCMLRSQGINSRFVFFFSTRIEHWYGITSDLDGEPLNIRVRTVNSFSADGGCAIKRPRSVQ